MASHLPTTNAKSETMPLKFDAEKFERIMEETDERIESAEMKIMSCQVNIMIGMGQNDDKRMFSNRMKIKGYKNQIEIVRVEKLIYQSLYINNNNNSRLFPLLLSKYSTLLTDDLELGRELVNCDAVDMNTYMEYCKESLKQHEYIKKLCKFGKEENN